MFKGTNKIWKGLALLLVLCMLPTVALAEGESTVKIVGIAEGDSAEDKALAPTYDADANTVTVTVEMGVKGDDTTILAVRSNAKVQAGTEIAAYTTEKLKSDVVYIDQEETDKTTGRKTFKFVPRSLEVSPGGIINIFVGGKDVNAIAFYGLDAKEPAPAPYCADGKETVWYKGENLVLNLDKTDSGSAYQTAAWFDATHAVYVNYVEEGSNVALATDAYSISKTDKTLTLYYDKLEAGIAIENVVIVDTSTKYSDAKWIAQDDLEKESISAIDKEAGSLKIENASVVAGATVSATIAEVNENGWIAALKESDKHTINGAPFTGLDIEGTAVTLTVPATLGEYEIILKATNYADYPVAKITVLSPTEYEKGQIDAKVKALEAANSEEPAYEDVIEGKPMQDGLEDQMYGKRYVDLSTITVGNGTNIEWVWTDDCTDEDTINAVDVGAGKYELKRSANKDVTYTLTGTIKKDGFDPATVTTTFTVGQLGIAGVDVTVELKGGAAKGATITLKKETTTVATFAPVATWEYSMREPNKAWTFKATAVPSGTYTMVIERSGYLTRNITVTVGDEALAIPAQDLLFGDLTDRRASGTPDGIIELSDFNALCLVFNPINDVEDAKYDMDGNGKADLTDFNRLCLDFMQKYPATSYPIAE